MNRKIRNAAFLLAALALVATSGFSQAPQGRPEGPGGYGGPREGRRAMAFGTVKSVGVNQFVVQKPDGSTVTVNIDSRTQLTDQNKPIQLEDLKKGDHVIIRSRTPAAAAGGSNSGSAAAPGAGGNAAPSTILAAVVRLVPPGMAEMFEGDRAFGRITAINGNQITIQSRQGEKTIVVSNDTQYMKDGESASLHDFKVGDPIMVVGKEANGQFAASRVMTRSFGGRRQPGPPE